MSFSVIPTKRGYERVERIPWLPCARGAPLKAVRGCQFPVQQTISPSFLEKKATSLCTKEVAFSPVIPTKIAPQPRGSNPHFHTDIKNIRAILTVKILLAAAKQSFCVPLLHRVGVSALGGNGKNLPYKGRSGQAVFLHEQAFRNGKIVRNFRQSLPFFHLIKLSILRVQHMLYLCAIYNNYV